MEGNGNGGNGSASYSLFASHEDRIQRLETASADIAASNAEQSADIRGLCVQVEDMKTGLVDKLDSISTHLGEKIEATAIGVKDLDQRMDAAQEVLRLVEKDKIVIEKKKARVQELVQRALIYVLTSGAAAAGALLLEHFRNH